MLVETTACQTWRVFWDRLCKRYISTSFYNIWRTVCWVNLQHNNYSFINLTRPTYCCYSMMQNQVNCIAITLATKEHITVTQTTKYPYIHKTSLHCSLNITNCCKLTRYTKCKLLQQLVNVSRNHSKINKSSAIANRSRVSCAHNTFRAPIGLNITLWPSNLS